MKFISVLARQNQLKMLPRCSRFLWRLTHWLLACISGILPHCCGDGGPIASLAIAHTDVQTNQLSAKTSVASHGWVYCENESCWSCFHRCFGKLDSACAWIARIRVGVGIGIGLLQPDIENSIFILMKYLTWFCYHPPRMLLLMLLVQTCRILSLRFQKYLLMSL